MAASKNTPSLKGAAITLRNRMYAVVVMGVRGPVILFDGTVHPGDGKAGTARLAIFDTHKQAKEARTRLIESLGTARKIVVVRLNDLSGVVL